MRLLITFTLFAACFAAIGQTAHRAFVDTASTYADPDAKGLVIENSFPKGGLRYTHPSGKNFVYAIFWTRVVNGTGSPLELTVRFPADSIASPGSYVKLFVPPDRMTLEKVTLYDYGVADLRSFLNAGFHEPTLLQRTIAPKEAYGFYVAVLSSRPGGTVRAGLVKKEQDLFYRITGITPELDQTLIPCGRITFKEQKDDLMHLLEDMLSQYDKLRTDNEQIRTEMDAQQEKIKGLMNEVQRPSSSLVKVREDAETLRKILYGYVVTIDSLNQVNKKP
jgi:hypothetical protein